MHTRRIKLRLYTSVEPAGRLERCYPQFVARCTELIAEQRRWAKEAHALLDRRRKWAARASERAHAADVLHDRDAKVGPVRVRPHMPTCLYLTRSTQSRSQSAIVNVGRGQQQCCPRCRPQFACIVNPGSRHIDHTDEAAYEPRDRVKT